MAPAKKSSPKKQSPKKCPEGQYLRKGYTKKAYCTKDGKCYPEAHVPPSCVTIREICPEGQILRLGYTRKAYSRTTSTGKKTEVAEKKIEPTCIPDVGKKGRGSKVIKMRKDVSLSDFGYKLSKSESERRLALDKAVLEYGPGPVVVRINKITVLQSRRPSLREKLLKDLKYVQTKYKYSKLY